MIEDEALKAARQVAGKRVRLDHGDGRAEPLLQVDGVGGCWHGRTLAR
jgi:hypothetical protein